VNRELRLSFKACSRITFRASSTFYLASKLFAKDTRRDIQALYAFCRVADDIADDPKMTKKLKQSQLNEMMLVLKSNIQPSINNEIWPAIRYVIAKHNLPLDELELVIRGVSKDVEFKPIKNFLELDRYSYLVAGVVGVLSARVLGVSDRQALTAAKDLGIAMQYTNIIRDVSIDYNNGRIYIPVQLQKKYKIDQTMLAAPMVSKELASALSAMSERAEKLYQKSKLGLVKIPRNKRRPVMVAFNLYRDILEYIKQKRYNVNAGRVRLSRIAKVKVVLRVYLADSL
jgi:phytoene synthase